MRDWSAIFKKTGARFQGSVVCQEEKKERKKEREEEGSSSPF